MGNPKDSASTTTMGYKVTAYVWGTEDKNITVSFLDDQAIVKIQTGIL